MDVETPIEMLMQKDYRACSAHLDKDDFIIPKRAFDPKNPKKGSLKKDAIPRVEQVAGLNTSSSIAARCLSLGK